MGFGVKVSLLFVTVIYFLSTYAAKLPSTFQKCSAKDPNFDECLRKAVEDAIHQLAKEQPDLGLKSLEPLDIPELVIGEGHGPVNVVQHYKNVKLGGLTDSKVLAASADWKNRKLYARSVTPVLYLVGDYTMNGKVMLLPLVGEGKCNITLIETKINHTLSAEPFTKNGKTYWNFTNYTVTLRPEKMIYYFGNLFNGDKVLGDNVLNVLNENWNEVFTDVRDGYEKSFGLIFHGLASRVFSRVPFKDIFNDVD